MRNPASPLPTPQDRAHHRASPACFTAEFVHRTYQKTQVALCLFSSRLPVVAEKNMGFWSQLSQPSFQEPLISCFLIWGLNQMNLDVLSGHPHLGSPLIISWSVWEGDHVCFILLLCSLHGIQSPSQLAQSPSPASISDSPPVPTLCSHHSGPTLNSLKSARHFHSLGLFHMLFSQAKVPLDPSSPVRL